MDEFDESQFIKKLFIFKKQDIPANETESKLSLAQIIKNLNKDPQSGIDDAESANAADTDTSAASTAAAYAPPYPVGIRLKTKSNPLEIGNHIISTIEKGSPADLAGVKMNSRLHKLNDVTCDDKTHEFVLFYLNYILRKNTCHSIEMIVDEPFVIKQQPSRSTSTFGRDRINVDLLETTYSPPSSLSTANLRPAEEARIHSALAALTKIVGISSDEAAGGATVDDILTDDQKQSLQQLDNNNKGSNENLKSIIQSIIWRPPFHKSEGSLFHSDSYESDLSNAHLSINQENELDGTVTGGGLIKDTLKDIQRIGSSEQDKYLDSADYYALNNSKKNIDSPANLGTLVTNLVEQQQQQQQQQPTVQQSSKRPSEPSNILSALAALTKITSLGEEEKVTEPISKENENLKTIVTEAAKIELPTSSTFKPLPYPYDKQEQQKQQKAEDATTDKPKSIQSALAALTKITNFGSELETSSNVDTISANYENLTTSSEIDSNNKTATTSLTNNNNNNQDISESDLLKLYRYQGRHIISQFLSLSFTKISSINILHK